MAEPRGIGFADEAEKASDYIVSGISGQFASAASLCVSPYVLMTNVRLGAGRLGAEIDQKTCGMMLLSRSGRRGLVGGVNACAVSRWARI